MENKFVQYIESIKHALDEEIIDIGFLSKRVKESKKNKEGEDDKIITKIIIEDSVSREELVKHTIELEKYISENCLSKKSQLRSIFQLMYFAIQQLYFDSFKKDELTIDFQILEGKVSLDITTGIYTFTPDPSLESLFSESERKNTARLKEVMGSRFYKLVEALYRVEK